MQSNIALGNAMKGATKVFFFFFHF